MPIPFRADLRGFLAEFAEQHRRVRLGQMFGLPAAYVGRRLFVCLMEDGIIVRLPPDVAQREVRTRGEPYSRRRHVLGTWVMYRPRSIAAARRLVPVLEVAAGHIAERQLPTPTPQDSTSQASLGSRGVGRWELSRMRKR